MLNNFLTDEQKFGGKKGVALEKDAVNTMDESGKQCVILKIQKKTLIL